MKPKIHPKLNKAKVICACGNVIETLSIKPEIKVEICSQCHPFYTGKSDRNLNRTGRVEKFRKKFEKFNSLPNNEA